MLNLVKGDLFTTKAEVIAHGVNCLGAFGAGVAGQIRKRYPSVYKAYLEKLQVEGWKLGDVQIVDIFDYQIPNYPHGVKMIAKEMAKPVLRVANCATQYGFGYAEGQNVYVDYKAVGSVFKTLVNYSVKNKVAVAMPRIGAGLAGGDWDKIQELLEHAMENNETADITVYSL